MKALLLIINLLIHINVFGQDNIVAKYKFESIGSYSTIGILSIREDGVKYSRKEENNTEVTKEGYELYHYKDYQNWYYEYSTHNIIKTRNTVTFPKLIAQWKADMQWEITEETKEIAGYKVQKAIAKPLIEDYPPFIYKNAIAWFTTEVPISAGPEGYYGLPGLIIKLEYSGIGIYQCTLQSLEFKEVDKWDIPNTKNRIKVSKNEIYNLGNIDKKWFKQQKKLLK